MSQAISVHSAVTVKTGTINAPQPYAYLWEDASCGVVCLNDDMLVELRSVQAKGGVESITLMVIEVHGYIYREAEEFAPLPGLPIVGHCRLCLQDGCEEVAMPAQQADEQSKPMPSQECDAALT